MPFEKKIEKKKEGIKSMLGHLENHLNENEGKFEENKVLLYRSTIEASKNIPETEAELNNMLRALGQTAHEMSLPKEKLYEISNVLIQNLIDQKHNDLVYTAVVEPMSYIGGGGLEDPETIKRLQEVIDPEGITVDFVKKILNNPDKKALDEHLRKVREETHSKLVNEIEKIEQETGTDELSANIIKNLLTQAKTFLEIKTGDEEKIMEELKKKSEREIEETFTSTFPYKQLLLLKGKSKKVEA